MSTPFSIYQLVNVGDVVQYIYNDNRWDHAMIVVSKSGNRVKVAQQSGSYSYETDSKSYAYLDTLMSKYPDADWWSWKMY